MKYLKQFGIIIIISFIGEFMNMFIPLPIPASIWGLVLMFLCLKLHIIKPEDVRETAKLLIEIMPIMFIPAAVGLVESWGSIQSNLLAYAVITVISTIIVMAVSGIVTQVIIKMDRKKKNELELWAANIRKPALQTIQTAGSGHIGGSFSICDIMSVLYFDKMNVDPANPDQPDRDRLVLSKGHCSPAMYATLALKGFFPVEHLSTFRKLDSDLSGHVEIHVPGVDMSAGSLGQGLSTALGMAMYAKANKTGNRVFCIMGDGEIQEGQVWEAAMCAGFYKADNLIAFVDNNNLQLDGSLEEVMSPYPIGDKFKAFGWNVIEIDGHDVEQIADAVELASVVTGKPTVIVAHTIKAKGVTLFENNVDFLDGQQKPEQWPACFAELDARLAELED